MSNLAHGGHAAAPGENESTAHPQDGGSHEVTALAVTPAQLHQTSQRLHEVATKMAGTMSTLKSHLGGEGKPWGPNDPIGRGFEGGSGGYLSQLQWVEDSIAAKTKLLEGYSEALGKAATSFRQHDGS